MADPPIEPPEWGPMEQALDAINVLEKKNAELEKEVERLKKYIDALEHAMMEDGWSEDCLPKEES